MNALRENSFGGKSAVAGSRKRKLENITSTLIRQEKSFTHAEVENVQAAGERKRRISNETHCNENPNKRVKRETSSFSRWSDFTLVDGYVQVFTDGSCLFGDNSDTARGGIGVWWGENHRLNVYLPLTSSKQSSTLAELAAVNKALEQACENLEDLNRLEVRTDCKTVIMCVENIPKWKKQGWCGKHGAELNDKEEIVKLSELLEVSRAMKLQIKWTWIPGHSGITGNNKADALAWQGASLNKNPFDETQGTRKQTKRKARKPKRKAGLRN